MHHYVEGIQMKNYLIIILGLIIATIGFAFAFSSPDSYYSELLFRGHWSYLLSAFPNLFTGFILYIVYALIKAMFMKQGISLPPHS